MRSSIMRCGAATMHGHDRDIDQDLIIKRMFEVKETVDNGPIVMRGSNDLDPTDTRGRSGCRRPQPDAQEWIVHSLIMRCSAETMHLLL